VKIKRLQRFAIFVAAASAIFGMVQSGSDKTFACVWAMTKGLAPLMRGELTEYARGPDWRIRIP
jgi:hypothetical protein